MRSNRQMRRWISAALCLLLTFSVLAGTLPTARAEAVSANTKEVVLNSMDSAADWHAESSDSVAISAEAAASGDRTALRVTGTYKQKASAFANLSWNAGGLNLTGAQKLLIDVYPEQTLEPRSLNLNISNGGSIIYMGSPFADAPKGTWTTVAIDLSGKDVSNLTELKFWLYGDDMPRDAECSMAYLLDNIRVVLPKTDAEENEKSVLICGMEDTDAWKIDGTESVRITAQKSELHTQGSAALKLTGTYSSKSGDFATMVLQPGELDLTGAKRLLMDVYLEMPLSGGSFNMNLTSDSGMVYMGAAFPDAQAGKWTTVAIDLSDKNVTKLTELKFWLYGNDMPGDSECSMTYIVDNIRMICEKQETPPVLEEVVLNAMDDDSAWRTENDASVAICTEPAQSGDRTALRVTGTYKQKSGAFANLFWNAGGLNLTGAQKLLIDVYPEQTLEPRSLNLNISNGGSIIYMGSPFADAPKGVWTTVEIDLSGKDVSNLTELKFWLYGNDMPRDAECSMVYLLDNIRVVKQKAAPAVTASPAAGKVAPGTTVTLALAEAAENAVIHYTTDGTDPRTSVTAAVYTAPISITTKTEIRAYASAEAMADGSVEKFRYTVGTNADDELYHGLTNFGSGRYLPVLPAAELTIDGDFSDWDTAAGITLALDKYFPAKPEGFSMTARAAYDASYFYMAVDVMDDVLDADYGYGMYGGDCLQIAFSEYGDDYGAEYGFSNYNGQPEIWRWYDGNAALEMQSVQFKTVRDEETGHTRYEIAFPWQSIFAAKPDGSFYMTMLAGDRDGGSSKATLEWRAGIGNGKKADDFAKVELLDVNTDWCLAAAPRSVGDSSATVDGFLVNFSDQTAAYQCEWDGQTQTVTVPAHTAFRKTFALDAAADGLLQLKLTATDAHNMQKQASWANRNVQTALDAAEIAARRDALLHRLGEALTLENAQMRFAVSKQTGSFLLYDLATGVVWSSGVQTNGVGTASYQHGDQQHTLVLTAPDAAKLENGKIHLNWTRSCGTFDMYFEQLPDGSGISASYTAAPADGWTLTSVTPLNHALWTLDTENGYAAVPESIGKLYYADGSEQFNKVYQTYGSYSMAFAGAVKDGSAMLIDWTDPDTALNVHHSRIDSPYAGGSDQLSFSLSMTQHSGVFQMRVLGKGGYVQIAKAYRAAASARGLVRTFAQKAQENPGVTKLYGAATAKPDTMIRSRGSAGYTSHTFAELSQVAQHWNDVLGFDRALMTLGGWIRMGFDNQYPDILPASPEAGGNEGLAALSTQVRDYGWLFGLHDNYQDMYDDAPSFDTKYLMYNKDGRPQTGGVWAGGTPYLMASDKAMEFAYRNLPQVKDLFSPNSYFIDTTFNVPLAVSYAPNVLSRSEDMHWKQTLAGYAQDTFGVFGSEGGVEWAVPYGDYFEGILSKKTQAEPGSHIVPLMELAYGDCVALYPHMSEKIGTNGYNTAKHVATDILYAENPLYQLTDGVYYENDDVVAVKPSVSEIKQTGSNTFQITYQWEALEDVSVEARTVFTHFTSEAAAFQEAKILFQEGHNLAASASTWKKGDIITDGPYTVTITNSSSSRIAVMTMLLGANGQRLHLSDGNGDAFGRYLLGYLCVGSDGALRFEEAAQLITDDYEVFSRNDAGYGEEQSLGYFDTLMKNSYEVLSPLNRLTAEREMTSHCFLTADECVEQTTFGNVTITVNFGAQPYTCADGSVLPQYGFTVVSPSLEAFYAVRYNGVDYPDGAMFVLSTDDGSAIRSASKVTVYHAFGDGNIRWRGKLYSVSGKQELSVSDMPVVPVKPSAPVGSGASGTKEPAVLPFTDVTKQDWFYGDVAYVYENSLMNGVSKTTFAPGQKTTRAMIVTILWRLEGSPAAKEASGFHDVPASMYYADAVAWAAENDIVNGCGGGRFAPDDAITREQLAAILYRYSRYCGQSTAATVSLEGFSDAGSVSGYAREALAWAYETGIVRGTSGNRINPTGFATRAETAAMLHRYLKK